jgi:hypothetical protein
MRKYSIKVGAALVLSVLAAGGGALAADPPAALIVDYTGKPDARLEPYNELAKGAAIDLAADARLVLMHYASCHTTTIAGGHVVVGAEAVQVQEGHLIEDKAGECPQAVKLTVATAVGGVVMRAPIVNTLPPSLACGVVGSHRDDIKAIVLEEDGRDLVRIPVQKHRLVPPTPLPSLSVGSDYGLRLEMKKATAHPPPTTVTIEEQQDSVPCLLHAD